MKCLNTIGGLVFAALTIATGSANAALTGPATINFSALPAAVFGRPNLVPTASGACPNGTACYIEGLAVFGAPFDPTPFSGAGAHIHAVTYATGQVGLEYDSDSSGIYLRMKDSSAFSLKSMYFHAPISADNPGSGPNDSWLIFGFSNAINPTLTTDATFPSLVATYKVANGFNNVLTLPSTFHNIKSLWIHYNGYPRVPVDPDAVLDPETGEVLSDGPLQAKQFNVAIDNVLISPPLTRAQQVECLFNWAEKNYKVFFSPANQATAIWSIFTYRYYAYTNSYLGVSSADSNVYYMGADGRLQNIGTLAYWLPIASCQ